MCVPHVESWQSLIMISSSMFSFRQYPFSPPHQINNIRHLFLGWQARKRHRSLPSLLVITNISYEGCSRHSLSEKAAASKSRNCIISQGKLGAQSYTSQRNITPWRGHCGDRSYRIVQIHLHKRRCTAWKNERFFSTSSTHIRRITNNHSKVSYEDYKHCMSIVEQRDFDAYLCGLLLPSRSQCQYTFYATRALNVEVASIKDGIDPYRSRSSINSLGAGGDMGNINSSNLPSKIRMQWWRDAIEQIYSSEEEFEGKKGENGNGNNATTNISNLISESSAHHPVIRAVSRSVRKCNLTRRFLDRIIDARDVDLDIDQLSTVQELVDYAEETASSLLYLSLEGSGVRPQSLCCSLFEFAHSFRIILAEDSLLLLCKLRFIDIRYKRGLGSI